MRSPGDEATHAAPGYDDAAAWIPGGQPVGEAGTPAPDDRDDGAVATSQAMRTRITSASTLSPNASEPQRSSGDKRSMMGRACNPISTNASTLTTKTAVSHTE